MRLGKKQMDLTKLYKYEMMFPEGFSRSEIKPYGRLFYTPDIPDSYDGNHAVVFDLDYDLDRAVGDIKDFYLSKHLTPRVYQSFQEGEEAVLFPVLARQGFAVSEQSDRLFIWQSEAWADSHSDCPKTKEIRTVEDDFIAFTVGEYQSPRMAKIIAKHLLLENFHQFVYREDGRPVATASLNIMEGFSRIDDVLTDAAYRNRGFATRLIDHIIKFHSRHSNNILYLFASDPAAIAVYTKQGFVESDMSPTLWSAWLEQA
jgi:GNAT superfamily N-acetyltransferase